MTASSQSAVQWCRGHSLKQNGNKSTSEISFCSFQSNNYMQNNTKQLKRSLYKRNWPTLSHNSSRNKDTIFSSVDIVNRCGSLLKYWLQLHQKQRHLQTQNRVKTNAFETFLFWNRTCSGNTKSSEGDDYVTSSKPAESTSINLSLCPKSSKLWFSC